jgi:hypothetical protein
MAHGKNVSKNKSCISLYVTADGVSAATQYVCKLKIASCDEPDYTHTNVGVANKGTTN